MSRSEGAAEVAEQTAEVSDDAPGSIEAVTSEAAAPLENFLAPPNELARVAQGLRSARVVDLVGRRATVVLRGEDEAIDVELDVEVDAAVVAEALENGDRVMVEPDERGELAVVGVLRCRQPEVLKLRAETIELEAEREVRVKTGKAALRLREDGEIDLVGSRISAASRGLFRLVGRMLRLN